ncbi:MAG: hypothetical protein ACRDY7_15220 [Acidimicrobiia bacterium]
MSRLLGALFVMVAPLAVPLAAGAQAPPTPTDADAVDVRIDEDTQTPRRLPQYISLFVTVTDRATGAPPTSDFNVYASAETDAGAQTGINACGQRSDNNLGVPKGIYDCTVIVDHGGVWTFTGAVTAITAEDQPIVTLGQATIEIDVDAPALAGENADDGGISGSASEVAFLWGHTLSAGAWGLCIVLLVALAVPGARRRLSTLAVHRIEERLDVLVKATWAATATTIGTGTYLLLNETAYQTPFSSSAVAAVFSLPYGEPYVLSLGTKLAVYAVMVAASVPLVREAQRALRLSAGRTAAGLRSRRRRPDEDSPWAYTPKPLAATLVAERERTRTGSDDESPAATADTAGAARLGAAAILAGGLAISLCVTLLKYFHQLIEASAAQ